MFTASDLDHLRSYVFRHSQQLTRTFDDAEDVTQLAMIRAWKVRNQFRGETSLRSWLYRLTFSVFVDWKRQQMRMKTLSVQDAPGFGDAYEYLPGPDDLVEHMEQVARINEAMSLIHPDIRPYFLGIMTYSELAESLGIPVGTVRSRLHRARQIMSAAA